MDVYLNQVPELEPCIAINHSIAYELVKRRALSAACDVSDPASFAENLIARPCDARINHLESAQGPRDPAFLLSGQSIPPYERLVQIHEHLKVRFKRSDAVRNLMTVQRKLCLKPKRIARSKPAWKNTQVEKRIPDLPSAFFAAVDLEPVYFCIASA